MASFNIDRMRTMAGLPVLKEARSQEEYATREKMISRIEGYFGVLESVPYDKISSEDLKTIYDRILEEKKNRNI